MLMAAMLESSKSLRRGSAVSTDYKVSEIFDYYDEAMEALQRTYDNMISGGIYGDTVAPEEARRIDEWRKREESRIRHHFAEMVKRLSFITEAD